MTGEVELQHCRHWASQHNRSGLLVPCRRQIQKISSNWESGIRERQLTACRKYSENAFDPTKRISWWFSHAAKEPSRESLVERLIEMNILVSPGRRSMSGLAPVLRRSLEIILLTQGDRLWRSSRQKKSSGRQCGLRWPEGSRGGVWHRT